MKILNSLKLGIFLFVSFSYTAISHAQTDSVLVARINFGGVGNAPAVNGWSNLNPWQHSVAGGKYSDMFFSLDGNDSITVTMHNDSENYWGFVSNNVYAGNQGYLTGNDSGVVPDQILRHYWFVQNSTASISISGSGIDNQKKYSLNVGGSRAATGSRITSFYANRQAKTGEAINNSTQKVEFSNVSPESGSIPLSVSNTNNQYGYLNWMEIWELPFDSSAVYPPAPPTFFAATLFNQNNVAINWNDSSLNTTGFELERSSDGGTTFSTLVTLESNQVSYTDSTLAYETYSYRLRVVDSVNQLYSLYSDTITVEVSNPYVGTNVDSVLVARINFGGVGNSPSVPGWTSLNPWQNFVSGGKYNDMDFSLNGNDSIFITMHNDTDNHWGFQSNDAFAGNLGHGTGDNSGIVPDQVLANYWFVQSDSASITIHGTGINNSKIYTLNMGGSRSTTGSRITNYYVNGQSKAEEAINNTTAKTEFLDVRPQTGSIHVSITNTNHGFGYLNWIEVWESTDPLISPDPPSALTLLEVDRNVTLSWTDNAHNETGFEIMKSTDNGVNFSLLTTLASNVVQYSDTSLADGRYHYRIRAVDTVNLLYSTYSATKSIYIDAFINQYTQDIVSPSASGQVAGSSSFPMANAFDGQPDWDSEEKKPSGGTGVKAAPSNPDSYGYVDFGIDYQNQRITGTWTQYKPNSGGNHTGYQEVWWDDDTDTTNDGLLETQINFNGAQNLPNDAASLWVQDMDASADPIVPKERYLVLHSDAAMTSSALEYAMSGFSVINDPGNLSVSLVDSLVAISWMDNSSDEGGFEIERSIRPDTLFSLIYTTGMDEVSFSDSTFQDGNTYFYRVRAVNETMVSEYTPAEKIEIPFFEPAPVAIDTNFSHTPRFDGNITAVRWKNANDTVDQVYSFEYDTLNRLKKSFYAKYHLGTYGQQGLFAVPKLSYDLNGNITELIRQGKNLNQDSDIIDSLSFDYGTGLMAGNQLLSVTDARGKSGFKDLKIGDLDYLYDDNGNLVSDKNKGIDSIYYNHLNLPMAIQFIAMNGNARGDSLAYLYDAAGIKLQQKHYKEDTLYKTTDYLGGKIYETLGLSGTRKLVEIMHAEGRIVPQFAADDAITAFDYQYQLSDHLGNVRVIFSTTPDVYTMTEDYEGGEVNGFMDLKAQTDANANTTQPYASNNKASLLNIGETSSMLFLHVDKSDTIRAQVNASYTTNTQTHSLLPIAYSALFGNYNLNIAGGEATTAIENEFNDALSGAGMADKTSGEDAPRAYINFIFFDKEMSYQAAGFKQISDLAYQALPNAHETVVLDEFVPDREGYILLYLSNENADAVSVLFDDFIVTQSKTNVVFSSDYYPYGLAYNRFERTAQELRNKYGYQGKEYLDEEGLDTYDFHARYYDPAFGRFTSVDPKAAQFASMSSYLGMGANPNMYVDPDGEEPVTIAALTIAIVKAAAVSATVYTATHLATNDFTFQNWDWGQFGISVGIGALSGGAAYGIGAAFGGVGGVYQTTNSLGQTVLTTSPIGGSALLHEGLRATAHGLSGVGINAAFGQDVSFGTFASGFIASGAGSFAHGLESDLAKIGIAGLAGGTTRSIGGGSFAAGFAQGTIIESFNHLKHGPDPANDRVAHIRENGNKILVTKGGSYYEIDRKGRLVGILQNAGESFGRLKRAPLPELTERNLRGPSNLWKLTIRFETDTPWARDWAHITRKWDRYLQKIWNDATKPEVSYRRRLFPNGVKR
ncbi:MAG: RHS repeat-associated core domain-containing protein [Bacteroidota bacterium]